MKLSDEAVSAGIRARYHRIVVPQVMGSTPIGHPTSSLVDTGTIRHSDTGPKLSREAVRRKPAKLTVPFIVVSWPQCLQVSAPRFVFYPGTVVVAIPDEQEAK